MSRIIKSLYIYIWFKIYLRQIEIREFHIREPYYLSTFRTLSVKRNGKTILRSDLSYLHEVSYRRYVVLRVMVFKEGNDITGNYYSIPKVGSKTYKLPVYKLRAMTLAHLAAIGNKTNGRSSGYRYLLKLLKHGEQK